MKVPITVLIGLIIWTVLLACVRDTPNLSPEIVYDSATPKTVNDITNSNLIVDEAMVKIEISTDNGVQINSGVIVGDGQFVVTYSPDISAVSTKTKVIHVSSKLVTAGSIIYIDELFGLALIRLTEALGTAVVVSQVVPVLGDELVIGDFFPIRGKDLTITRYSTVTGFEFDGLVMRFDGIVGSGNVGGPVLNGKGQLVGIVTHGLGEGESGRGMSPGIFKYGLAEKLVKYSETATGNISTYRLDSIGIPADVTTPSDWSILSGFGYFDMRSPGPSGNSEDTTSSGYKVIGIINADSSAVETSEEVLNRLIAEFGEAFKRVPGFVIPQRHGLDKCELLLTVEEYSRTAFERRGYVIPGSWVSRPGIYTGFCTGIGKDQRVIVFAESHDVDDIVQVDGLFQKIALVN